jgi:hypothetical protein
VAATALLSVVPPAAASANQFAILEDEVAMRSNPDAALATLRALGVGVVRVALRWNEIAPDPSLRTAPPGFNAANPDSYPAGAWSRFDAILRAAQANGIQVLLLLSGPAPLWATASDRPSSAYSQWKPWSADYEQFVEAIARRYDGRHGLPRVNMWEIWNEPNWGQDLSPQAHPGSTALESPAIYRGLLNAGWTGLGRTGHGHDTIMIGSLSPRGHSQPGYALASYPLTFVRRMYCVDGSGQQLRGRAAAASGCPTTAGASRTFPAANPALFKATGFAVHPYPFNLRPTQSDSHNRNDLEFNQIPRLVTLLDQLQRVYRSHNRFVIYNTEYGFVTDPPNSRRVASGNHHFVSPGTAGLYINWAEYLSWRNPRIASTMQFLLNDPNPTQGESVFGYGGFAAGLIFYGGKPKADYYAYRMPLFLPISSTRRARTLEVWGCVRPASHVGGTQRVQVQLRRGSRGVFRMVTTVRLMNARGYFDVRVKFPGSGAVRLAWRYPKGGWIYSRTAKITIG